MTSEMAGAGDQLLSLLKDAAHPVLLVAPFIKQEALSRLLSATPREVPVTCVTRWRPDEVASGVSDLEVLDLLAARDGSKLFLQAHLHAKLFRTGERRLVGSANITGRALGWVEPANLELLVALDGPHPELEAFEAELFGSVSPATREVQAAVAAAATALASRFPVVEIPAPDWSPSIASSFWLPTCPRPDLLFRVYDGSVGDILLSNAKTAAQQDLAFLEAPAGLNEGAFTAFIGAMLRQVRWMQELDKLTTDGLTDDVAVRTIAAALPSDHGYSPEALWNVTKEWFVFFFPGQYDRVPAGEMLRKRRQSI
uniref:phospholipase D family protein n=1 Tax=Altererythrobacter segetis TaxID=1104773 RepID=UPI00140E8E84|nr:phospholipase D family protein [Altererythrobacter segetis]